MPYHAYGFVDGGYLRELARKANHPLVNPRLLVNNVVFQPEVQSWCARRTAQDNVVLARVTYYDGRPDKEQELNPGLREYWEAVELLPDTELGFGSTRTGTRRRPRKQKGVDTLIAVDMLVGAFTQLFPIAILVAGDADFVPVVNEVRRRGVMVVVAADEPSMSDSLRRAADRFVVIGPGLESARFPALSVGGKEWQAI
jgi:uncharacterized LabA/DUF88 family protein